MMICIRSPPSAITPTPCNRCPVDTALQLRSLLFICDCSPPHECAILLLQSLTSSCARSPPPAIAPFQLAHDPVAQRARRLPRRAAEALEIRRARHQNSAIRTPDAPHDPQRLAGDSGLMTASDHVTDSASKQAGRTDPDATGNNSAARAVTRGPCYSNQPIPRASNRGIYLTHVSFRQ